MDLNKCRKVENEAGYPLYIDDAGLQYNDHPQFSKIMESLEEYNDIKYSAYRVAFKVFALQRQFRVPALHISSGVFARHQLSLSESSLSLDTGELEAVLADIYFAAQKEDLFTGDIDLAVDLLINLLLNVYDKDRKEPIRVLAAKTLLIVLSEESVSDKWAALANCCADHNGCVSPRRLSALLTYMSALPQFLGDLCDQIQSDVDSCFAKSAGMLGVGARSVAEWGAQCASARWLCAAQRVRASRNSACASATCAGCAQPLIQVLKFKCSKCSDTYFCEKCYLYDKDLTAINGHKQTHLVHEIIDGESKPPECLSFIQTMRKFFFCTKTKKKKTTRKRNTMKKSSIKENEVSTKRNDVRPKMVTSTVGKASGHTANNPESMLQDIITQLETQNKALEELSAQLQNARNPEEGLRVKVDSHWSQISKQINRLKILKENLSTIPHPNAPSEPKRPDAFDLFSPIPIVEQTDKRCKMIQNPQSQPRVLSLDSGNFSVMSKQTDTPNLVMVSGDALKPVAMRTSDTISTVSMRDISSWYNEADHDKPPCPPTGAAGAPPAARGAPELDADLDTVLDRLQQILTNNFTMDESSFDNNQLRETANEMEGLLGSLIRGVEQRATLRAAAAAV